MSDLSDLNDLAIEPSSSSTLGTLIRSEIDQQITTAKRYPRALSRFMKECMTLVTESVDIAASCNYTLPRRDESGKFIQGPSARFAEMTMSVWGNCRAGARIVNDQGDFVTAQGVFHDLERNACTTYEVQRRVVDKNGKRYSVDMIANTCNAACSIALRNAVLKGIPKAIWYPLYLTACKTAKGDRMTFDSRRADAITKFESHGVSKEMLCEYLSVAGIQDISMDHLVTLGGLLTALEEGDISVAETFGRKEQKTKSSTPRGAMTDGAEKDLNAAIDQAGKTEKSNPPIATKTAVEEPAFAAARLMQAADYVVNIDDLKPLEEAAAGLVEPHRSSVLEHLAAIRNDPPTQGIDKATGELFS